MKGHQTNFTQARLASLVRKAVDKVVAQVSNQLCSARSVAGALRVEARYS
jgi:hypothetical protein